MTQIEHSTTAALDTNVGTNVKPVHVGDPHKSFMLHVTLYISSALTSLAVLDQLQIDDDKIKAASDLMLGNASFSKCFDEVSAHLNVVADMVDLVIKTIEESPGARQFMMRTMRQTQRVRTPDRMCEFVAITLDEVRCKAWIKERSLEIGQAEQQYGEGLAPTGLKDCADMLAAFEQWHQGEHAKSLREMGFGVTAERFRLYAQGLGDYTAEVVQMSEDNAAATVATAGQAQFH